MMAVPRRERTVRHIKLVVFDLDGTLIDAYAAVEQSVNHVMRRLGLRRVGKRRIVRAVGWGERHLLSQFVPAPDLAQAAALYRRHHVRALKNGAKLLPGSLRLLKQLKQEGYRLAVASNRATRFSRLILRNLEIDGYFCCILCRDKVERPKPFPDILLGIIGKLRIQPEETLFVGDMTVDMQAGQRAGICTVAVTTGSSTKKELQRFEPLAVIPRIYQTLKVLKGLDAGFPKGFKYKYRK